MSMKADAAMRKPSGIAPDIVILSKRAYQCSVTKLVAMPQHRKPSMTKHIGNTAWFSVGNATGDRSNG